MNSAPAPGSGKVLAWDGEPTSVEYYWSGWRGGLAGGVADQQPLPEQWTGSDATTWKVEVSGRGNSSPIIWGDRLWITTTLGVAEDMTSAESSDSRRTALLCFDRRTGHLLWKREVDVHEASTHRKNGYASATPAASEQYVVASFGAVGLYCFNHDGEFQWRAKQPRYSQQWGTASSPLVVRDMVIQVCDSDSGQSNISAYRLQTGERIWQTARTSHGSWSSPILIEVEDSEGQVQPELIVNGTGTKDGSPGFVIAYDPRNGRELWRVKGTTDIPCPTALYDGQHVISTSGGNGPLLAITRRAADHRTPPDATSSPPSPPTSPELAWSHDSGGPYVPTGVVYQGHLYLISDGGRLCCYRTEDGERMWRQRLNGSFSASLVAGDGKIYAVSEQGEVRVIVADPARYQLLATNDLGEQCLATPAISEGELIFRTERHLLCIARQDPSRSADPVTPVPAETTPSPSDLRSGKSSSPTDSADGE